ARVERVDLGAGAVANQGVVVVAQVERDRAARAGGGERAGVGLDRAGVGPARHLPGPGDRDLVAVGIAGGGRRRQAVVGLRRARVEGGRGDGGGRVDDRDRGRGDGGAVDGAVVRGHLDPQLVALGAVAGAGEVERAGGAAEQVAPGGAAVGRLLPLVGERDRVAVVVVLGEGRGQQVVGLRRALVDRGGVDDRGRVDDRDRRRGDGGAVDGAVVRGHLDPQLVALGSPYTTLFRSRAGGAAEQVAPGGAAVGRLLPLVGERDRVAVVV